MSSILTNASSLTALQYLRSTQMQLNEAQRQISTGLKISGASDNASTWSIAETMKSDKNVLLTLKDSLGMSSSMLGVATAAVNSAITVMNAIKAAAAQAQSPGADLAKIGVGLEQLGQQLSSIVQSASFNGINLLNGTTAPTASFIASYTDNSGAAASVVGTIDLTTTALVNAGAGILEATQATGAGAATNFTTLSAADVAVGVAADTLSNADFAIAQLTNYASQIGAVASRVQTQETFVQTLADALTTGVSSLVDADMNDTSTRLQALQTRQQLGVQSISIANQDTQLILKLFQ
jgi:flagellin